MNAFFRGRPYSRLVRQLEGARHTLITETAKAEEAQAKAALAKAQIERLEAWIKEADEAYQRKHGERDSPGYPRPVDPHGQSWPVVAPPTMPMTGYQPRPA